MKRKSVLRVILTSLLGMFLFLILLLVANLMTTYISNPSYHASIAFANEHAWQFFLIFILAFFGDLFLALPFPFNLPAPLFNALASLAVVALTLNIFDFVDARLNAPLFLPLRAITPFIYVLVFFLVLVIGFFRIALEAGRKKNKEEDGGEEKEDSKRKEEISWSDVGNEFRGMLRDSFRAKRKTQKKKKDRGDE